VTELVRFDVMLGRLLVHRRADVGALARAARVLPRWNLTLS
jgi:hypothetical protein